MSALVRARARTRPAGVRATRLTIVLGVIGVLVVACTCSALGKASHKGWPEIVTTVPEARAVSTAHSTACRTQFPQ